MFMSSAARRIVMTALASATRTSVKVLRRAGGDVCGASSFIASPSRPFWLHDVARATCPCRALARASCPCYKKLPQRPMSDARVAVDALERAGVGLVARQNVVNEIAVTAQAV